MKKLYCSGFNKQIVEIYTSIKNIRIGDYVVKDSIKNYPLRVFKMEDYYDESRLDKNVVHIKNIIGNVVDKILTFQSSGNVLLHGASSGSVVEANAIYRLLNKTMFCFGISGNSYYQIKPFYDKDNNYIEYRRVLVLMEDIKSYFNKLGYKDINKFDLRLIDVNYDKDLKMFYSINTKYNNHHKSALDDNLMNIFNNNSYSAFLYKTIIYKNINEFYNIIDKYNIKDCNIPIGNIDNIKISKVYIINKTQSNNKLIDNMSIIGKYECIIIYKKNSNRCYIKLKSLVDEKEEE